MQEGQQGTQCGCREMSRERSSSEGREGSHRALRAILRTLAFILSKLGARAGSGAEKGKYFQNSLLLYSLEPDLPKLLHQISFPSLGPFGPLPPSIEQRSLDAYLRVCPAGREGERCALALVKASTLWKK